METNIHVKTTTEVKSNNKFIIYCHSDMNADETTTPDIFKSRVLQEPLIIDNIPSKEGELVPSYDNENDIGSVNNGNYILSLENDDVEKYVRGGDDDIDLEYEQD